MFNKKKDGKGAPELRLLNKDTPFAINQAYKTLYTNILYLNIEDKCKKIAITSALPAEGKTTLSCNLALTLAQNLEEKKVLLVDCDLRSPKVWRLFGFQKNAHGLSEYLAGIDEEPSLNFISQYNLTVMTAGSKSINPTKLIGSQKMKSFIEYCNENYDYVIVDTPPIDVVTDALLLNGLVNGYIVSTRADKSDIKSLSECVDQINRIGAEIYGFVISDLKLKANDTKYGKYSRYGDYQVDNSLANEVKKDSSVNNG